METFTKEMPLVPNPNFDSDRRRALESLRTEISKGSIDEPTMETIEQFAALPCVYTLQSCYGHFMTEQRVEDRNTRHVSDFVHATTKLHYRIAYIAFCIENSARGRNLLEGLKSVADADPEFIQFGCAEWFWNQCVNSYVLQVSPQKNAHEDHFEVNIGDALSIERVRDKFFKQLREVLSRSQDLHRCGPSEP